MHPLVALMRRFAVGWLDRADASVCAEIMDADYTVHIGGHVLRGRDDAYVPATLAVLERFPGLQVAVHELITDGERAALRFTLHGPSAAWRGIGLFGWDGQRLTRNVTEEDYLSRRRQLAEESCDPVAPSAPDPWAAQPVAPDPAAEAAVRAWLAGGLLEPAVADDGRAAPPLLDVEQVEVGELFSAGRRVAFHAVQTGTYRGGLPGTEAGGAARLGVAGLVAVDDTGAVTGHVVRDRAGLRHAVRS